LVAGRREDFIHVNNDSLLMQRGLIVMCGLCCSAAFSVWSCESHAPGILRPGYTMRGQRRGYRKRELLVSTAATL
jgi:hypothetical protein